MNISWQSLVTISFLVILLIIQLLYWYNPLTISQFIQAQNYIFSLIYTYPLISSLLYIMLYTGSILFGIPISATIIGGYFFGMWLGILLSLISMIIGTTILAFFSRYVMNEWLKEQYGEQLKPFKKELDKYGLHYMVMIYAIPFMPGFLPTVAISLSSYPLYQIILVNIASAFPLTLIYTAAGAYIHTLNSLHDFTWYAVIFGCLFALLFGAVLLYRRWWD